MLGRNNTKLYRRSARNSRAACWAAARITAEPAVLQVGNFVLARRGDGRPKIGALWTGPWLVLDRIDNDPTGVVVQC